MAGWLAVVLRLIKGSERRGRVAVNSKVSDTAVLPSSSTASGMALGNSIMLLPNTGRCVKTVVFSPLACYFSLVSSLGGQSGAG